MRSELTDFINKRWYYPRSLFPSVVVAVPARNEQDVIATCLQSIGTQSDRAAVGIVCVVNDSDDATFAMACAQADQQAVPVRVYDILAAPHARNAGGARRIAMDLAAAWLDEGGHDDGLVLTTDADSEPTFDWVYRVRAAIACGADAVAGTIELYPEDAAALPDHLHARGALEARYDALLTELFSHLDPRVHDPWPRHSTQAGANLAVTLKAYRAIGGLPRQPCGEDKALVALLDRRGFRVRHDPTVSVKTSGRLEGRAEGGVADTIRLRCIDPSAACDSYLEPALNARFRGFWRGRLRGIFGQQGPAPASAAFGGNLTIESSFGAFWGSLEIHDPRLSRTLLRPCDLPSEIEAAEVMLRPLRARSGSDVRRRPVDSPLSVPAE